MKPSLFDCIFLVIYASASVIANEVSVANATEGSTEEKSSNKADKKMLVYRAIFKQKRAEQTFAAESILKLGDYSKQYKMVEIVLEKLFKVLQDARVKVTESGYIPGQAFPTEQAQLEALGNVLENTALFGDILLRLPDMTYRVYSKSKEWELLARWSVSFCNETQVYDETDSKLLNLMAQELRLVPRDPNYINPYRNIEHKENLKNEKSKQEEISKKDKKKKDKKKRGPRLSHGEL
ncbi:hypothetical protein ACROYT_G020300 [Oculina patagonica]